MLAFAGPGMWIYDGRRTVLYVTIFLSIGLGNLAWAVGRLVADEGWSRIARCVTLPVGMVMFLSMVLYGALALIARFSRWGGGVRNETRRSLRL